MKNFEYKTDNQKILGEVSGALFELRDALVELSIALRDWQFETDLERRKINEIAVQQLLLKLGASRDPNT